MTESKRLACLLAPIVTAAAQHVGILNLLRPEPKENAIRHHRCPDRIRRVGKWCGRFCRTAHLRRRCLAEIHEDLCCMRRVARHSVHRCGHLRYSVSTKAEIAAESLHPHSLQWMNQ